MVDVDVQVARTTAAASLRRRDPGRFTAAYVAINGSHRFYGRDYPGRLRRAGFAPLRFDPLRGLGPAFRRAHGLKADARVYLAFASPAAARGVRPGGARTGQRIFLSFPVTVRSTSPSRTRE